MFMPAHCGSPLMTNDESRFTLEEYKLPASSEGNPYSSFVILEGSSEQARARHSSLKRSRGWVFIIAQPVIVFVTVFVLFSCTGGRYDALLRQADSLLTANPDSAWALLSAVDSADMQHQRRSTRMRYQLLRAEAQNKAYVPFTTDSVLRRVVRYYDRCGSANQQLKARYLLGCAYRDMHEAPLAIIAWEEAVERADTLSHDCDYSTLYRVYGQMADLFMRQRLPKKQLKALQKYCDYALLAGDTLVSLHGRLLCNSAYYTLLDTIAIFENAETIRLDYLKRGLTKEAARVYPIPFDVAVETHQYDRARRMMDIYEQESGLFDEQGNILDRSRIQHYYYKGLYYLGIHKEDSAEIQFRKLLSDSTQLVLAYRGLFKLYQIKHEPDSAFKYGHLFDITFGKFTDTLNGEAIIQAKGLYDYQRQEKAADKERKKNQRITTLLVLLLFAVPLAYFYARRKRKAKAEAMRRLEIAFAQKEEDLENTRTELRFMKNNLQDLEDSKKLLSNMEERIHRMEEQLKEDARLLGRLEAIEREEKLMNDDTVILFQRICQPHDEELNSQIVRKKPRTASKGEWKALEKAIKREHLSCYIAIEGQDILTPQEKKVALLSRIDLQTQEMATIIGCSYQSVSNSRSSISKKLFNSDETSKINKKLKAL
ncbi:MAG: hypothetical protein ILA06_05245 [Bacteroidaceae bacterium]|nr:hypothetical protein [Bacteroidaceae bacterium]